MSNDTNDEQDFLGNESKRWLVQAKEDLKSAEILQDGQRFYLVCNGLPESVPAEFFDESDALHALEMARKAISTVEESFISYTLRISGIHWIYNRAHKGSINKRIT